MKSILIIGVLSVVIILAGAGFAYASTISSVRRNLFESCGGILFIAGLALLGLTLPH